MKSSGNKSRIDDRQQKYYMMLLHYIQLSIRSADRNDPDRGHLI